MGVKSGIVVQEINKSSEGSFWEGRKIYVGIHSPHNSFACVGVWMDIWWTFGRLTEATL